MQNRSWIRCRDKAALRNRQANASQWLARRRNKVEASFKTFFHSFELAFFLYKEDYPVDSVSTTTYLNNRWNATEAAAAIITVNDEGFFEFPEKKEEAANWAILFLLPDTLLSFLILPTSPLFAFFSLPRFVASCLVSLIWSWTWEWEEKSGLTVQQTYIQPLWLIFFFASWPKFSSWMCAAEKES